MRIVMFYHSLRSTGGQVSRLLVREARTLLLRVFPQLLSEPASVKPVRHDVGLPLLGIHRGHRLRL
jgi:hypothetical protein